jgi:hypothetical protein
MDLIGEFRKSIEILRSNLILFLPALIMFYLIPVALLVAAIYIFTPIIMIALKSVSPLQALFQGSLIGLGIIIVVAVLAYVYVTSGSANMYKQAVLKGTTSMSDFWEGCQKYFGKILAGFILFAVVYGIILLVGLILTLAMILPIIPKLAAPRAAPDLPLRISESERLSGFAAWMIESSKMVSYTVGLWLLLLTISGFIFMFTLFWIQALIVDELGTIKAIAASIAFVRKNLKTTIGIASLWIIAQGFTNAIFPGGGMGGGGPGYGYGFGFPPPLQAIFQLLIATVFTLLLYTVYASRTGKIT